MNFHLAEYRASFGLASQLPKSTRPEVAFAGRSNVGKSSLLNKLMFRKGLAKVSSKPGKTATINFYDVDEASLVDLPGYGYAKVSHSELDRWADLIEGYFNDDRNIALAVVLVDIRHDPSELDKNMISFLKETQFPFAIALTKADKLSKQKAASQRRRIVHLLELDSDVKPNGGSHPSAENASVIVTSVVDGRGIETLQDLISLAVTTSN